jgi:signal peptidase II
LGIFTEITLPGVGDMLYAVIGAMVVILDQVTKLLVQSKMHVGQSIKVLHPVLYFTYVKNPGAAFGIFPAGSFLFVIITFVVLAGVLWYLYRARPKDQRLLWGIVFCASGALGNVIDRLRIGKVVDFIDVRIWPIFNVADMAIVLGVILVLLYTLKQPSSKATVE